MISSQLTEGREGGTSLPFFALFMFFVDEIQATDDIIFYKKLPIRKGLVECTDNAFFNKQRCFIAVLKRLEKC